MARTVVPADALELETETYLTDEAADADRLTRQVDDASTGQSLTGSAAVPSSNSDDVAPTVSASLAAEPKSKALPALVQTIAAKPDILESP